MKIVHSLWTYPFTRENLPDVPLRNMTARWRDAKSHWACWMLSARYALASYNNVHLVTDNAGAEWMRELGIPYSSISTHLDGIEYPSYLWAVGKIHTYLHQKEPFLHIDGDVFLTKRLPERVNNGPIVIQNFEYSWMEEPAILFYEDQFKSQHNSARDYIIRHSDYLPNYWLHGTSLDSSACMAIFGGNDLDSIKAYSRACLQIIEAGWMRADKIEPPPKSINQVIEQMTLFAFGDLWGWQFEPLWHPPHARYEDKTMGYVHVADGKKKAEWCQAVMDKLGQDFPDSLSRLNELFPTA